MSDFFIGIKSRFSKGLGQDVLWTLIGQVLLMLVLLIINKFLSNVLSIEDFGRYNVIRRSTTVLSFMLLGGLGIAMPRYLPIFASKGKVRNVEGLLYASWLYLFVIAFFISIVYILFYRKLVTLVIGADDVKFYILCLAYAMTVAVTSYIYAYYRGLGKFKLFNISQIIVQLLLLIPLIFRVEQLFSIIVIWTLTNFLFAVGTAIREFRKYSVLVRHYRVNVNLLFKRFKELFIYSFPRLFGDFFLFAYSAFPAIYIGMTLGLEQTSYYSVGISLVTMVTPIYSFLGVVLLPTVSKMMANNQIREANRLVSKLALVYIVLALLFTGIVYLGIDLFIHFFFADKYLVANDISKVLVLSILPQSIYLLYRNPNDAVSVFPFNTVMLAASFVILVVGFMYFHTLLQYAYVYLFISIFQCCSSVLAWTCFYRKKRKYDL